VLALGCAAGEAGAPSGSGGAGPGSGGAGSGGAPVASGGTSAGSGGASGGSGGTTTGSSGGSGSGGTNAGSGGTAGSGGANAGSGGVPAASGGLTGSGGAPASGTGGGPVPTGGVPAVAMWTDDFESSATGAAPKGWIADPDPAVTGNPGMWGVVTDGANHVYEQQMQTSSLSLAVGGNVNWTDFKLETRVRVVSTSSTSSARVTLAARYQDAKNYLLLELTLDGKIKLRSRTDSSSTDLATNDSKTRTPIDIGGWTKIGIGVSGPASKPTVTAYLNGAPVMFSSVESAAGTGSGGIALGATAAVVAFDDVTVTPP